MQSIWIGAAALALTLAATPAQAAFSSAYTDINLNQCLVLQSDDFATQWSCPGYKGYPLLVTESDLSFSLQYGFNVAQEPERQRLPMPSHLGPKLEWRLSNASGRWLPIATIARYFTGDKSDKQLLVVTQLLEGQTCHIAYIDALANADANALAQAAADKAGSFDCASDKIETIGAFKAI